MIKFDRAIMIYIIKNYLCPDSSKGRFLSRSQLPNYPLRNSVNFNVSKKKIWNLQKGVSIILEAKFETKLH